MIPEHRGQKEMKGIPALRVRRAIQGQRETQAIQAPLASKGPRATQVRKAQKVTPEQLAQLVQLEPLGRALTLPHRLAATRTPKPIFTLTLPQCRGFPLRWRRFKGAIKGAYKQN